MVFLKYDRCLQLQVFTKQSQPPCIHQATQVRTGIPETATLFTVLSTKEPKKRMKPECCHPLLSAMNKQFQTQAFRKH